MAILDDFRFKNGFETKILPEPSSANMSRGWSRIGGKVLRKVFSCPPKRKSEYLVAESHFLGKKLTLLQNAILAQNPSLRARKHF